MGSTKNLFISKYNELTRTNQQKIIEWQKKSSNAKSPT